jgi:hypothetical protein
MDAKTEKLREKKIAGKTMDLFYEEFKTLMNETFRIIVERD